MERSVAVRVAASITKPCQSTEYHPQLLVNSLTAGTTVTPIGVVEANGNRESMATKENAFNHPVGGVRLENSRWDKADVGAGTAARARWVPQSQLDQGTTVAV